MTAARVSIRVNPDRYPPGGEFTCWLATCDIDGTPHTDATGATVEMALARLAEALAEDVAASVVVPPDEDNDG